MAKHEWTTPNWIVLVSEKNEKGGRKKEREMKKEEEVQGREREGKGKEASLDRWTKDPSSCSTDRRSQL